MKFILILALVSIGFISCKKENCDTGLTGSWVWVKATGGLAGVTQTPQNTGLTWHITINANGNFSQTGNLFNPGNGTYTLTEDNTNGWLRRKINLTPAGQPTTSFTWSLISGDSLRLDENIETDGLSYFLVRE